MGPKQLQMCISMLLGSCHFVFFPHHYRESLQKRRRAAGCWRLTHSFALCSECCPCYVSVEFNNSIECVGKVFVFHRDISYEHVLTDSECWVHVSQSYQLTSHLVVTKKKTDFKQLYLSASSSLAIFILASVLSFSASLWTAKTWEMSGRERVEDK